MLSLNDKNFHRGLKQPRLLVMFTAAWAGPCNIVRPVFQELAGTLGKEVTLAEFDVDDNPTTPGLYGVRALPAFVMFEGGVPSVVKVGALPMEALTEMIYPPEKSAKKTKKVEA